MVRDMVCPYGVHVISLLGRLDVVALRHFQRLLRAKGFGAARHIPNDRIQDGNHRKANDVAVRAGVATQPISHQSCQDRVAGSLQRRGHTAAAS